MSKAKSKALLVGNGINRVFCEQNYSWGDLLQELSRHGNGRINLTNPFKPFPLAFEEILSTKSNTYNGAIRALKQRTAEIFNKIPVRQCHRMIANSGKYHDILTTNYEYTLENAYAERYSFKGDFRDLCDRDISTNEEIHSLMRKYVFSEGQATIWHIHGEINHRKYKNAQTILPSNSILIGYSQYVSYLDTIYKYMFKARKSISSRITSLRDKVLNYDDHIPENPIETWVDFFFFRDIDIIGLTLDFSEIHLWWILNRRFSLIKNSNIFHNNAGGTPLFQPVNTITYYYPVLKSNQDDSSCSGCEGSDKQAAITEMLQVLGVKLKPITCDTYEDFYTVVFK